MNSYHIKKYFAIGGGSTDIIKQTSEKTGKERESTFCLFASSGQNRKYGRKGMSSDYVRLVVHVICTE